MAYTSIDQQLVFAANSSDTKAVRALLERQADPRALDSACLSAALDSGDAQVFELLLSNGAEILFTGSAILFNAVHGRHPTLTERAVRLYVQALETRLAFGFAYRLRDSVFLKDVRGDVPIWTASEPGLPSWRASFGDGRPTVCATPDPTWWPKRVLDWEERQNGLRKTKETPTAEQDEQDGWNSAKPRAPKSVAPAAETLEDWSEEASASAPRNDGWVTLGRTIVA